MILFVGLVALVDRHWWAWWLVVFGSLALLVEAAEQFWHPFGRWFHHLDEQRHVQDS